jgi:DNA-directed RNA polymerase specialized sigma24 family protein
VRLSDAAVVRFVLAGCNATEIAEYARIEVGTAIALVVRARQQIARAKG